MLVSLALLWLPWDPESPNPTKHIEKQPELTRRQTLLDLIGLVRVLQDERVQEPLAPELQLDVLALGGFLEAGA
jgi:hypothetical protein